MKSDNQKGKKKKWVRAPPRPSSAGANPTQVEAGPRTPSGPMPVPVWAGIPKKAEEKEERKEEKRQESPRAAPYLSPAIRPARSKGEEEKPREKRRRASAPPAHRPERVVPRQAQNAEVIARGLCQMAEQAQGNLDGVREKIRDEEVERLEKEANAPEPPPEPHVQGHKRVAKTIPILVPASPGTIFGLRRAVACAAVGVVGGILGCRATEDGEGGCSKIAGALASVISASAAVVACVAAPYMARRVHRYLREVSFVQAADQPETKEDASVVVTQNPTKDDTRGIIECLVSEVDLAAQRLSVRGGLSDSLEVGRVVVVSQYDAPPAKNDVRPANVRAMKAVDDVVDLLYGEVQPRATGRVVPLLWSPEVTTIVRSSVPTVSAELRLIQCQELSTRVTNLTIPAPIWNVVQAGSATVAAILSQNSDVHRQSMARLSHLNSGWVAARPMLMGIASVTGSPLLTVSIMAPVWYFTQSFSGLSLVGLCSYLWGHGSVT